MNAALFFLTRNPMLWVDALGIILHANDAFKAMTGFNDIDLEQRQFSALSITPWQTLIDSDANEPCEWLFYNANKVSSTAQVQLIPAPESVDHTPSHWLFIAEQDIKESVSPQLVASEKAFRTLFDKSFDAMAFFNMSNQCQVANRAFSELLGYSQDEIRQLHLAQLGIAGWEDVEQKIAEQMERDNATGVFERAYRHKEGHSVPVSMRATAVKDDNDKTIGTWFILRDISKNQLQLRTLQHQQHLLELTGRLAGVGGWEFVEKTRDVKFTPEACKLLGISPNASHKLTDMLKRFVKDSSYEIQASVEVAFLLKTPFDIEVEYIGFKQPRYLRLTGRIKKDGDTQYIVGAVQDISRFRNRDEFAPSPESQSQLQTLLPETGPQYQDKLTSLPNKLLFTSQLKPLLNQPHDHPLIFIEIDLQNFRRINENAGYSIGDECLKQTARRIQAHLPTNGLLARIGGDEFGIALTHHTEATAETLADSLIQAIARPIVIERQKFQLQAAACIVISAPQSDSADLLRAANEGIARIKSEVDASYVIRLLPDSDAQ